MNDEEKKVDIRPISIYLAGPVDGISSLDATGWRVEACDKVLPNVLLFSPPHAFMGTGNSANAVVMDHLLRNIIRVSDALVANLNPPGRGFGTIREIEWAVRTDTPVVIWSNEAMESLMVYDVDVEHSLEQALSKAVSRVQALRQQPMFPAMFMRLQGDQGE